MRACKRRCHKCGGAQVFGTSKFPICPRCDRAYYALEVDVEKHPRDVTFDEVIRAMIQDDAVAVVGIAADGDPIMKRGRNVRLPA